MVTRSELVPIPNPTPSTDEVVRVVYRVLVVDVVVADVRVVVDVPTMLVEVESEDVLGNVAEKTLPDLVSRFTSTVDPVNENEEALIPMLHPSPLQHPPTLVVFSPEKRARGRVTLRSGFPTRYCEPGTALE
jgi:hypothetical protein